MEQSTVGRMTAQLSEAVRALEILRDQNVLFRQILEEVHAGLTRGTPAKTLIRGIEKVLDRVVEA